ncbi:zinc finger MYM-type protein 1-like [Amphibalanus amphitrite]|uniref:zinc finger MYM-type protein 1-like n=1 Tax=Amphibalanus amphitrite TaxID=1232801 RepID=UPI001C8FDF5C|nr:zinc finger MYM-type protein 1-like [Amphibalanus amphitrite]
MEFPITSGRRFRYEWFKSFKFLSYDIGKDVVKCHTCLTAVRKGLMKKTSFRETAFLEGFSHWGKATTKFREHEKSTAHQRSTEKLVLSTTQPITAMVNDATQSERKRNTETYLQIISVLRGLARSGVAVRGHSELDGNLTKLLEEKAALSPEVKQWMERKTNFLTHDCQDEIFEIMAKMIQRQLVEEMKDSGWFSIIADGTTDVAGKEQICVCYRFVNDKLEAQEVFLGLYAAPDSTAATLTKVLLDATQRLVGGISHLRGMCFDGASNMSGQISGVQARLASMQPKAIFVHCFNHSLDLALVEEAKQVPMIADVMNIVRDVSTCLNTAKRKNMFRDHVIGGGDPSNERHPTTLLALCPTRWTVRCQAFRRFVDNYDAVVATVDDLVVDSGVSPDVRSKLRGIKTQMSKWETIFGMFVTLQVFEPCEALARKLQSPSLTFGEAVKGAEALTDMLETQRSDDSFNTLYANVEEKVKSLESEIQDPREPRQKRPPKKLEQVANPTPPTTFTAKGLLRKQYFEALDIVHQEVKRRFVQPGVQRLKAMEELLLAGDKVPNASEIARRLAVASPSGPEGIGSQEAKQPDIDAEKLCSQLQVIPPALSRQKASTVKELATSLFGGEGGKVRGELLSEVVKLCRLILTVPVSVATGERVFSTLRQVKTYARSTMSQARLSHLMLLNVHERRALDLDLRVVMQEFVEAHPAKRIPVFGRK